MNKRPLCVATGCYMIGIIMGLYLKISIVFFLCIFLIIEILLFCKCHKKRYCLLVFMVMLGVIFVKRVDYEYMNQYHLLQEQTEYVVEAVVISDVTEEDYKYVYEIEIRKIDGSSKYKGKKWLLNIKKNKNTNTNAEKIQFGDLIIFYGEVEFPSIARNNMGFDYQQYLKSKKIYGTMITKKQIEVIEKEQTNFFEKFCHDIGLHMKEKIYMLLPEDAKELCIGILIGEQKDISEHISQYFRESNLTHMLAVSGSHISYIVSALTILLCKAKYRFRKILTIVFLIFFMGLTKFTPSVQRASIMAILVLMAGLLYRKADIYTNLASSCLFILICNPYTILDVGFQLSYGGTIGIVLFHEKISTWLDKKLKINQGLLHNVIESIIVTISANLIIVPIMAFQFNTVSFTFWIPNLLATPLMGVITLLGFILYIISLVSMPIASIIAIPLKYLLYLFMLIAKFGSKIPFSSIIVRTPFLFEIIIYYFCIYIIYNFLYFKKQFFRILSLCLIFTMAFHMCVGIGNHQGLRIYFIDVGQGDCTLIRTQSNQTILIDGGGSETGSFDVGEKTLLPYLLDRKITKIDYMMISHFDTDHVGGLLYILEHLKVENVVIAKQGKKCDNYERFRQIAIEKRIPIFIVEQGDRISIDQFTYFDILFPQSELISENILNNNSIVAKLNYGSFSMLFTGDIEEVAEREILETYKNGGALHATVLKVAHHGSKSSSIKEILESICPNIAVIGVGEKNTFGHPNEVVLKRLESVR